RYRRDFRIFISAEKVLDADLTQFQVKLKPERMHHALACAEFFLGDSQTMTAEAAVLGTPALRLNDFVGQISYLTELERYELAYGFRPGEEPALLDRLDRIIRDPDVKEEFAMKRRRML